MTNYTRAPDQILLKDPCPIGLPEILSSYYFRGAWNPLSLSLQASVPTSRYICQGLQVIRWKRFEFQGIPGASQHAYCVYLASVIGFWRTQSAHVRRACTMSKQPKYGSCYNTLGPKSRCSLYTRSPRALGAQQAAHKHKNPNNILGAPGY